MIGICQTQSLAELTMTMISSLMNFAVHAVEEAEKMVLPLQKAIVKMICQSQMHTETIVNGTHYTKTLVDYTMIVILPLLMHAVPVVMDLANQVETLQVEAQSWLNGPNVLQKEVIALVKVTSGMELL